VPGNLEYFFQPVRRNKYRTQFETPLHWHFKVTISMFIGSSKDLRKGVVIKLTDRRSSSVGSGSTRNEDSTNKNNKSQSSTSSKNSVLISSSFASVDDMIEKVKNDRQHRQNDREMNVNTIRIQSWYRGMICRQKFRREQRKLFDNNISDISRLLTVCKSRNIEFVTPIDVSLKLFILFFQKYISLDYTELDEINRILSLCEFLIFPSLLQADSSKNIISNDHFLDKFGKKILDSIMHILKSLTYYTSKKLSIDKLRIKKCVLCLIAFAGRFNENISLNSRFNVSRQNMENSVDVFKEIRIILASFSQSLIDSNNSNNSNNSNKITPSPYEQIADELVLFLIYLIDVDGSNQEKKIEQFYSEIFTVPIFTLLLSEITIKKLLNWKYLINVLKLCRGDDKILPATSSAIKSKHWLFGTSVIHQGSTFLYTHQSYYFSYNR